MEIIVRRLVRKAKEQADAKLRRLWSSLVRLGVARGLRLPDAEDLAQESILAGTESFEPSRGNFEAFCHAIMANKAKNLHRDRKPQEPTPDDGGTFRDPDSGPGWASYHKQCRERADRILADTVSALAEEEAHFFFTLAEVHAEHHHGEVSEAARRVGVTPLRGWDIFRKIQRKFKDLDRTILLPQLPVERVHDPDVRFSLGPLVGDAPGRSAAERAANAWMTRTPSDIRSPEDTFLGQLEGHYRHLGTNLGSEPLRRLRRLLGR